MQHMGYALLREMNGLRCYSSDLPETAVFLDLGDDNMVAQSALHDALEASGVNLNTFYAFLESL